MTTEKINVQSRKFEKKRITSKKFVKQSSFVTAFRSGTSKETQCPNFVHGFDLTFVWASDISKFTLYCLCFHQNYVSTLTFLLHSIYRITLMSLQNRDIKDNMKYYDESKSYTLGPVKVSEKKRKKNIKPLYIILQIMVYFQGWNPSTMYLKQNWKNFRKRFSALSVYRSPKSSPTMERKGSSSFWKSSYLRPNGRCFFPTALSLVIAPEQSAGDSSTMAITSSNTCKISG